MVPWQPWLRGRDSDGYTLRASRAANGWRWSVQAPGAGPELSGYDVDSVSHKPVLQASVQLCLKFKEAVSADSDTILGSFSGGNHMMNGVLVRLFATCLLVCACVSTTLAQAAKTRISVIDSDGRTAYEGPYTGVSPFGAFVNVANPDGRGVFEIDVDKNAAELSFVEVSKGDLTDLDVEYIDKYKSATQTLEEHLKLYPLRITVTTVDGKKYRDRSAYGASVHVMLSKPNGDNFKIEAKDLKKIVLTRPK